MKIVFEKFRLLLFLLIPIIAFVGTLRTAYAASTYVIKQLTNNDYDDTRPQISENGRVTWMGEANHSDWEIFLSSECSECHSASPIQLTTNDYGDSGPQINGNGHVVWQGLHDGEDFEIFLYDGSATTRITTNDSRDVEPQINDSGYVAWGSWTEIFLYDGTMINQITTNDPGGCCPKMNESGHVVWDGHHAGSSYEIFLYDGITINQITTDNYDDSMPNINDNGNVVWQAWHGGEGREYSEVFLYDGTETNRITTNDYWDNRPQINNNGDVVWQGLHDGEDFEIFLYDGSATTRITTNDYHDGGPQINDHGHVAWHGQYDVPGSDNEIFFYDGTSIHQITHNTFSDAFPQINNQGCITWVGGDSFDGEIFLACPAAEPDIVVRPDFIDFPWWKSEEYWGGEPRLIDSPFDPFPPEIQPEPMPCPRCSLSRSLHSIQMPSQLLRLYRERRDLRDNATVIHRHAERMIALFNSIPTGQRFNKSLKASVIKELKGIKWSKSPVKPDRSVLEEIQKAINAIELDWRVPSIEPQTVKRGDDATIDFQGIASVTFKENQKAGKLMLTVESGVPALVKGFNPGWPMASYHFDFTQRLSDPVDIGIFFGGRDFDGELSSLRLFEWDGKTYKDITTVVDLPRKVIRGRTDKLSTLVIMRHVDIDKEKVDKAHKNLKL